MSKNYKQEKYITQVLRAAFFGDSSAKSLGGIIGILIVALPSYFVLQVVITNMNLISFYSLLFVYLTALTLAFSQNFLMFYFVGRFKIETIPNGDVAGDEIIERCKKRNRNIKYFALVLIVGALAPEIKVVHQYESLIKALNQNPNLWLAAGIIIITYQIILVGNIVEVLRVKEIASKKDEMLRTINDADLTIRGHQVPELLMAFVSARMIMGYAVGVCIVKYMIS